MENVLDNYHHVLSEDPIRKAVLRSFYAAATGNVTKMTFRMATEDHARQYLTDEDFVFWLSKKAEYQEQTGDVIPF